MKNKNLFIVLMSVALSIGVLLLWQYSEGDWDTYIAAMMLLGGLLAVWFAYRFLLAFLGKREVLDDKKKYPVFHSLEDPMVKGEIQFHFDMPERDHVLLAITKPNGKEIKRLIDEEMGAGNHPVVFDTTEISNGVYYYEFKASSYKTARKMIVHN